MMKLAFLLAFSRGLLCAQNLEAAFTPSRHVPLTLHANYGRGINSVDARGVVQMPDQSRLATTDFYQLGASSNLSRFSFSADGSFEFKGACTSTAPPTSSPTPR